MIVEVLQGLNDGLGMLMLLERYGREYRHDGGRGGGG